MHSPKTFVNSPLARVARLVLNRAPRVAMVLGQTVHLSGATREEFLADPEWVAHEQVHLRQVRDLGVVRFLYQYLVESARVGYYQNRFEVEAREGATAHMRELRAARWPFYSLAGSWYVGARAEPAGRRLPPA